MVVSRQHINDIIQLVENRVGLSAKKLERINPGEIIEQVSSGDAVAYLRLLRESSEHHPVWQRLIHALTIGETYFLRDKDHFRILRETILPRLILERRESQSLELTIWSAGCSTGEEPYSIATVLYESIPDIQNWQIQLYGSDINQRALDSAEAGIYREWSFRHTPAWFRQRYFTAIEEGWKIADFIREMVTFTRMNASQGMPGDHVDIIFARHMLMYLSKERAIAVEDNLHSALRDGGWFFPGQAEALRGDQKRWLLHMIPGTPIYQKIEQVRTQPEHVSYPVEQAIQQNEIADDSESYKKAVEALHADHPDEAEIYLTKILADYPDHARAHILMGAIFANRKVYVEALKHIHVALEQSELLADAHYVKALVELEQDESENAIQSFGAALYCDRKHALSAMMLGNLYQGQGDGTKASRFWRNALTAVELLAEEAFVSELSDMTVAGLRGMIARQQSLINGNGSSEG